MYISVILYYELRYNMSEEIKFKYVYNNEEIISMVIVGALVIAGTWGIAPFGYIYKEHFWFMLCWNMCICQRNLHGGSCRGGSWINDWNNFG